MTLHAEELRLFSVGMDENILRFSTTTNTKTRIGIALLRVKIKIEF